MSRLVRLPAERSGIIGLDEQVLGGVNKNEPSAADGYLERVAKYVPSEVLAFFIVISIRFLFCFWIESITSIQLVKRLLLIEVRIAKLWS